MQFISPRSTVAFCLALLTGCIPDWPSPENHIFDPNEPVRYPHAPPACEFAPVREVSLRPQAPVLEPYEAPLCPEPPPDWTGPGQANCEEFAQLVKTISGVAGPACETFRSLCEGALPAVCPVGAEMWLTDWPFGSPQFCDEVTDPNGDPIWACGKWAAIRVQCCYPPTP